MPVTGRNVTVAVLDTGINSQHSDLAGKVVQNVRLVDTQSLPVTFAYPAPLENLTNTDLVSGHGTFVGGVIADRFDKRKVLIFTNVSGGAFSSSAAIATMPGKKYGMNPWCRPTRKYFTLWASRLFCTMSAI